MDDFDDVAAGLADRLTDARQIARRIGDQHAQSHNPAGLDKPAQQYRGEQPVVDVAAADHQSGTPAAKPFGLVQHRGQLGRAGALDDQAGAAGQPIDRFFDARLVDQQ